MKATRCNIDGCEKPRYRQYRMCSMHCIRKWRHGDPLYVKPRPTPDERFDAKTQKAGPDDCWLWLGTVMNHGYGQFRIGTSGKNEVHHMAHRYAWERVNGPIPEGLTIDHLCEVILCVNPAHMEPVTNSENARRRWTRQRERGMA